MISNYDTFHVAYVISIFFGMNLLFILNFIRNEHNKFVLSAFLIIFISIMIGIRGDNIGLDSAQYAGIYMGTFTREGVEPFFLLIHSIFYPFFSNYLFFFLLSSIIINGFILLSFRRLTPYYPLAMALFLSTFLFINLNINILRQAYAFAFTLYAIALLMQNEKKQYWVFLVFGIFVHYTAAVFLAFYFLRKLDVNKKTIIFFVILLLTLWNIKFSQIFLYLSSWHDYFSRVYYYFIWNGLTPWHFKHIYFLAFLLISFYVIQYRKVDIKNQQYFLFYLFGFVLVFLFKEEEMVADRFFYYVIPFGILLIINLKSFFKQQKVFYLLIWGSMNIWYLKTALIQFPSWFVPPFEGIRWAQ